RRRASCPGLSEPPSVPSVGVLLITSPPAVFRGMAYPPGGSQVNRRPKARSSRWQSLGKYPEKPAFCLGFALAIAKKPPYSTTTTRSVAIWPPSGPEPDRGWFAGGGLFNALDLLLGKTQAMAQTIALVDDDRNILTSVQITLEAEGFNVRTYTDGAEALRGLTANPVDLAILDIKMPRMDGMELLERLRRQSELPLIFLTSTDDEGDELIGLR